MNTQTPCNRNPEPNTIIYKTMKSFLKKIFSLMLILALFGISSCKKDFETSELDSLQYGLAIPLGTMSLSIDDLIDYDNENIQVNADSSIQIIYRNDSILGYSVEDLISIPEQDPRTEEFKLGIIAIDDFGPITSDIYLYEMLNQIDTVTADSIRSLDGTNAIFPGMNSNADQYFSFDDFDNFERVVFSEGELILSLTNNLPVEFSSAQMEIYTIDLNLNPILIGTFTYSALNPGQFASDTIQLANSTLYNSFEARLTNFVSLTSLTPVLIDLDDGLSINLIGQNLKVVAGKAKLPQQDIDFIDEVLDFGVTEDERIVTLTLNNAILEYNFISTFKIDFTFQMTFPTASIDGNPVSFEISANTSGNGQIDLSNCLFDLTSNPEQPYNQIPVNIALAMGSQDQWIEFDSSSVIQFSYYLKDLEFGMIQGWIGKKEAELGREIVQVADDLLDKISGTIVFDNPQIKLLVSNNIGIPVSFQMDIQNVLRDGSVIPLDADVLTIPYPTVPGNEIVNEVVIINNSNSNLSNFLSQIPRSIEFSGNTYLNFETPASEPVYTNFITSNGSVKLGLEIDLPIALSIKDLEFVDTLETNIDTEVFEQVEYVELSILTQNGIPFEMDCLLELFDDINQPRIDSIMLDLLDPALIDNTGKVSDIAEKLSKIYLDKNRVDNLARTKHIRITAKVNSSDSGNQISSFYTDYTFDIKLGLLVRYLLEVE